MTYYQSNNPITPAAIDTGDLCDCGGHKADGDFLCPGCRGALNTYRQDHLSQAECDCCGEAFYEHELITHEYATMCEGCSIKFF